MKCGQGWYYDAFILWNREKSLHGKTEINMAWCFRDSIIIKATLWQWTMLCKSVSVMYKQCYWRLVCIFLFIHYVSYFYHPQPMIYFCRILFNLFSSGVNSNLCSRDKSYFSSATVHKTILLLLLTRYNLTFSLDDLLHTHSLCIILNLFVPFSWRYIHKHYTAIIFGC
jgi:hypothetical protein